MGVKLMTGATGEQNIQAADDRECLAGITGLDSYVFPTGNKLKATLADANTVTIGTGAGSLQGSRFRCSTTTTVTIQSGTQSQFRHDIIGLHFSRENSGREGLEFRVLTGKPASSEGAAADPAYTAGNLLKGDAEAFMPLYRVKLSGINAADPEPMFSILMPLARTVTVDDRLAESSVWCDAANSQRVCLTARTADRARGHALVASDTSMLLYDLDAQKPIWTMRAQHPTYYSSVNSASLTVTAPHDCVIEVEAWFERQWGYGGGEATLSILTPAGLESMCAVTGNIYGGNIVGRSLHAFGAFSGAKGGETYTFTCSLNNSGTGLNYGSIIARCFPA